MDKVDNLSLDWDNFNVPNDDEASASESDVSKVFNQ